jgi:hypothetical protein
MVRKNGVGSNQYQTKAGGQAVPTESSGDLMSQAAGANPEQDRLAVPSDNGFAEYMLDQVQSLAYTAGGAAELVDQDVLRRDVLQAETRREVVELVTNAIYQAAQSTAGTEEDESGWDRSDTLNMWEDTADLYDDVVGS